ncbi:MAG: CRISPR system precrRNA processing endoribonuclease RAMP protein Cas6 [Anaerolineae bacterium]|nr:CRISPR system precrRNA processing endoribonuclease RAMP protein Cas6 [Anaerolineae bacterium]
MHHFTAHRLRFTVEAQDIVELNEHPGSAIRGALFHALRNRFCGNREAGECVVCLLVTTCPVATLVSTLRTESQRGRDVPRPYTIQPPLGQIGTQTKQGRWRVGPGERFEFGLTLYARAMQLFPYVVLAVSEFERGGIGRRVEQANGRWQRGRLAVREVWAENPLTGEQKPVLRSGDRMVYVPDIPVTHQQITHHALRFTSSHLTLRFLTPTRIIERGHLLKPGVFHFQPFFQRLMERLEALSRHFSDTPLVFDAPKGLIAAAGRVKVVDRDLRWEELHSYSTRRRAESPTSGFMGSVVLEAEDWSPFMPWLLWGQFTHVGKDAVKGNGWYEVGIGE